MTDQSWFEHLKLIRAVPWQEAPSEAFENPIMTDQEYSEWLEKQNAEAGAEIIVPAITDATMFLTERSIESYLRYMNIENAVIILEAENLIPWLNRWIDEQTARPLVLSFGAFNYWSQMSHDLYFTKDTALDAYEAVMAERFPHQFVCKRVIKADEWVSFFNQYGASGIVAGAVDRDARLALEKAYASGYAAKQAAIEALTATYYFSEAGEAAFARMAF